MTRYHFVTYCIAALFVFTACGKTNAPDASSQANPTEVVSTLQTTDAATVVTDATPAIEAPTAADAAENDSWSGNNFANKLDTLDSYTATFTYTSTSNGKESTWVWQQKVIHNPAAMEIRTNSNGSDIQAADFRMVKIADKMYTVTNDPVQCIVVADQSLSEGLNPDSIIGNIPFAMQKTGAGPDVFGHATDAYAFTGNAADGSNYQSNALLERNVGYAMRWEVTGKEKNGATLEPMSWKYELSDINAVAPVTLPKECENIGSGTKWPMPDGAQVTMETNEMLGLTSAKSVKELTDFYSTAMKDAGYESSDGGMTTADSTMLMFKKDSKTIAVIISLQDGKGMVIITQQ